MNRRQILEEVAAGRLEPAEAARRLSEPAGGARAVRVRAAYHAVEVVADPEVADLVVVDGTHRVRREDDVLIVSDAEGCAVRHLAGRTPARAAREPAARHRRRGHRGAAVGAGVTGALRAVVQAGSAGLEGVSGALELRVTSGSARVAGSPLGGDWRLRSESASLEVVLDDDADATVAVASRHSQVDALGSDTHAVVGSGAHAIDIDAAFSNVVVRTP